MFDIPVCSILKSINCEVKVKRLNIDEFKENKKVADNNLKNHKKAIVNMLQESNETNSVVRQSRSYKRIKIEDEFEDMGDAREKNIADIKKVKVAEDEEDSEVDEEIQDMEEEFEIKSVKKQDEGLSPYEKMILKNQEEKLAFLQSLKIDEVKAGFIESVNIIKKKPKAVKKRQIKKTIPSAPVVLRKSRRLAKMDIDLSEEAVYTRALAEAVAEENKKVIPPILPFEEALQFKELYQDFLADFDFQNDTDKEKKPVVYDKDIFRRMVIEESSVAKVAPSRITALALHTTREKIIVSAGSKYGDIGIWNVESDSSPYVCSTHHQGITNLQYNPFKMHQLVSSSYDGTVRLGDFETKIFSEVYNISEETSCTYFDFLSPVTFLVAQRNGKVALVDNRTEGKRSEKQHQCHDYSIKTVHVHPIQKYYFVTAENKGAIRLWDLRKLQHKPVAYTGHHRRCVNSAYFSPVTGNSILSTSADDTIGIFDSSVLSDELKLKKSLKHNNFTGRWLTVFRATWIPNNDDAFVVGSNRFPRCIEVFNGKGSAAHNFIDENLTTITSCNVFHPFQPVLAAGNSSGKVFVFKKLLS